MTAAEQAEYRSCVGQWLQSYGDVLLDKVTVPEARMQNVQQVSAGWNDVECQAFEDGAVFLSALIWLNDTWLPDMLYVKSAARCVKKLVNVFDSLKNEGMNEYKSGEEGVVKEKPQDKHEERGNERIKNEKMKEENEGTVDGKPVRPKHIDQYVHLLPEKTQERAAMVRDLLRQMDVAREKARLLMDDPQANGADRARWAKEAADCDKKVRSIYKELDAEWAKLVESGRVTVDAVGNVRVENEKMKNEDEETGKVELTSEQKAKRRSLRKWLADTRSGNSSEESRKEHAKKWRKNFSEYLKIEGDAALGDEKLKKAAEHYGVKGVRFRVDN